jgi:hypothetical protein
MDMIILKFTYEFILSLTHATFVMYLWLGDNYQTLIFHSHNSLLIQYGSTLHGHLQINLML